MKAQKKAFVIVVAITIVALISVVSASFASAAPPVQTWNTAVITGTSSYPFPTQPVRTPRVFPTKVSAYGNLDMPVEFGVSSYGAPIGVLNAGTRVRVDATLNGRYFIVVYGCSQISLYSFAANIPITSITPSGPPSCITGVMQ